MKTKLWHATSYDNLSAILEQGILCGCEGLVYACVLPEEAARFVAIRGVKKILLIEFKVDDKDVHESFDHSFTFFQCKSFCIQHAIKPESLLSFRKLELDE